jgi:tRNA(Ile)-lysidine synthase
MFVTDVQAYIEAHAMLPPGAKVIVTVSGGPDSMALLSVLAQLQSVYNLTLYVTHVNHQLRAGEAERDAQFVAQQARRLNLPLHQTRIDVKNLQRKTGLSPQHAARQLRYGFFRTLQQSLRATHIALGHTADDQAETLIMRLLRGSGPTGIAGIPAIRGPFIRPLLTSRRQTILAYLQSTQVPWIQDSSNSHRTYLRNRVRLDLLPVLQQYNPCLVERLHELSEMLRADNTVLEQQTDRWAASTLLRLTDRKMLVQCTPFSRTPLAIQRRLLRKAVGAMISSEQIMSFQHIEALRQLVLTGLTGQRLTLPRKVLAERHAATVLLWDTQGLPPTTLTLTLPIPGSLELPELHVRLTADVIDYQPDFSCVESHQAFVDFDRLGNSVAVRFRQPGDRFHPLGGPRSKKLQDFFVDNKIPRAERSYVPLVVSRQEIVWVVGYRLAEPFKVRPDTRHIVRLQCRVSAEGPQQ